MLLTHPHTCALGRESFLKFIDRHIKVTLCCTLNAVKDAAVADRQQRRMQQGQRSFEEELGMGQLSDGSSVLETEAERSRPSVVPVAVQFVTYQLTCRELLIHKLTRCGDKNTW